MEDNFYMREYKQEQGLAGESIGRYTAKTFLLMFAGLLVTFAVAFLGYYTWLVPYAFFTIPGFHLIVLVAELAVAVGMTALIHKISVGTALVFFFLYSALTGITFATYFYIFDFPSLILVFGATALYFGGMAVFGFFTNIDLSRMRTLLLSGLIFLIIANVLMMFLPGLQAADRVVCTIGVVIFLGYTAYDTQRIKNCYSTFQNNQEMLKKASVFSALQLYLDFINMFLYLLRIFGKRKN
mgnify:CR=1 FL=1